MYDLVSDILFAIFKFVCECHNNNNLEEKTIMKGMETGVILFKTDA